MMNKQATIAYRNPDGSFRDQQALRPQEINEPDLIGKAAELFLPAFRELLLAIERGEEDNSKAS